MIIMLLAGQTMFLKNTTARQAFLSWCHSGKPRYGPGYVHMYKSRAAFSKHCNSVNEIKSDFKRMRWLSYNNVDAKKFWKGVTIQPLIVKLHLM